MLREDIVNRELLVQRERIKEALTSANLAEGVLRDMLSDMTSDLSEESISHEIKILLEKMEELSNRRDRIIRSIIGKND